jgi:hypothetical protein
MWEGNTSLSALSHSSTDYARDLMNVTPDSALDAWKGTKITASFQAIGLSRR